MDKIEIGAFKAINPGRTLTAEVVERLASEISSGQYAPGTRLPSEHELISALSVSRTVLREAVAALKARGLVTTRQGSGVFVASASDARPYAIDEGGLASLDKVIQVLELRMAVEVESAVLASQRASQMQIDAIAGALEVFRNAIQKGERAVQEDFAFHRAIAAATGNARLLEFIEFMGRIIIPRQSIHMFGGDRGRQRRYLRRIEKEHTSILAAIADRAPDRAHDEMRAHLLKSLWRYRKLASCASTE